MKKAALLILFFAPFLMSGAHLVGGEISYVCNGNNNYTVTLKVYRDCNSTGAPFDPNAIIAVFNGSTFFQIATLNPSPMSIINIPPVSPNPCLQTPPNICTEMATYSATINLPPSPGGYILTYQRCCRNQTITNIPTPGTWGSTYTTSIPPNDNSCNSSPAFASNPPIVLCTNDSLNINSAAVEPDGDSLYYEFCSPLHGGDQNFPQPGSPNSPPVSPPPYTLVPFLGGYSASVPITSNPTIHINPNTGLITGKPTQAGQYVVAICVSEYRNGVKLSTVRRDYQFNVTNCISNVVARMAVDSLYCTGRSVSFNDNSINATKYFWDFGEDNTNADTSSLRNPVHTFADTGTYTIMLVINKGWSCSDTVFKTVKVHYPANASFVYSGSQCFESGPITFTTTSNNSPADTYSWDFGPDALTPNSLSRNPPPVLFTTPGSHLVSLEVNSFGCIKTVYDTVKIYLQPTIGFDVPKKIGCAPFTVRFNDSSSASTTIYYEWDFGDGDVSTAASPVHIYQNPGLYDVRLKIYTAEGCLDTLEIFRPNYISVNPSPTSVVSVSPTKTTIYEAIVEVKDLGSQPDENFFFDMDDGKIYTNIKEVTHHFNDTGTYHVMHVVTNSYGCADTTIVPVHVNPVPLIFAPNAFSPNNDGKNDIYLPSIVGSVEYELIIFSRWGDVVFKTTDPYEGWNGNDNNTGPALPVGVYTFTIFVRDINYEIASKKGYITLMR